MSTIDPKSPVMPADVRPEGLRSDKGKWLLVQIPRALHIELHHGAKLQGMSLRDFVVARLEEVVPRALQHLSSVDSKPNSTVQTVGNNDLNGRPAKPSSSSSCGLGLSGDNASAEVTGTTGGTNLS